MCVVAFHVSRVCVQPTTWLVKQNKKQAEWPQHLCFVDLDFLLLVSAATSRACDRAAFVSLGTGCHRSMLGFWVEDTPQAAFIAVALAFHTAWCCFASWSHGMHPQQYRSCCLSSVTVLVRTPHRHLVAYSPG